VTTDAPKIEFPCEDYPIKVMGDSGDVFYQFALEVLKRHAPDLDEYQITVKQSSKARYQSITFFVTATGVEQLDSLHKELRTSSMTKIVL
jgi:putative lipoic acid-binding regulatory protein